MSYYSVMVTYKDGRQEKMQDMTCVMIEAGGLKVVDQNGTVWVCLSNIDSWSMRKQTPTPES